MRGNWLGNWFGNWFNPAGGTPPDLTVDSARQRPAWRLRIRAPRSIDVTEATLLSVAAGGPSGVDKACFTTRGPLRPNLLDNPEAATVLTGWAGNLATVSRQTSGDLGGFAARVECVTTDSNGSGCYVNPTGGGVAAAPGDVLGFSMHVDGTTAVGKVVHLVVHWWNGTSFIATPFGPDVTLGAGWQRLTVLAAPAPAGTVSCVLACYTSGAQGVFTFSASGAQVEEVAAVGVLAEGEGRVGLYNHQTAGYYPLLNIPSGRRNTIDFLGRKLRSGNIGVRILDARIAGDNAERLLSAFLGSVLGEPQLLGCKVEIDSTDDVEAASGTVRWARWYTGRIDTCDLDGKVAYVLSVSDMAAELLSPLFSRGVHESVTYAVPNQLWPLGLGGPYGALPAAPRLNGTIGPAPVGGGKAWRIKPDNLQAPDAAVTEALTASDVPSEMANTGGLEAGKGSLSTGRIMYSETVIVRLRTPAFVGDYEVGGYEYQFIWGSQWYPVNLVYLRPREGGPAVPADGTVCSLQVLPLKLPPSRSTPLLLNDRHPIQLIADALDGVLGPVNDDGSIRRTFPRDEGSFAAMLALPRGPARCLIEKATTVAEFIEGLCRQFNYGYRLDEYGRVVVFDLELPQALGELPTLTDADLLGAGDTDWSVSRKNAITQFFLTSYVDVRQPLEGVAYENHIAQSPSQALLKSYPRPTHLIDFGRLDTGDGDYTLDAWAIRTGDQEIYQGMNRELWQRGQIIALLEYYRSPFASGPMEMTLRTRRTATTTALREGQLALIAVPWLPNPGISRRGGTRLVRVIDRNDDANGLRFRVLDMGPNANLSPPALGAIAADTDSPYNAITVPLTLNGTSDPARLELAITGADVAVVASVPADAWRAIGVYDTSGVKRRESLPAGKRLWLRARSERPSGGGTLRLPSAWTYPTAPGYLDLAALPAPTGLAVSGVNTLRALLTWNAPAVGAKVEVWLAIPSSDPLERAATLPAGSEVYEVTGTVSGNTVAAAVRVVDGSGGASAFSSAVTWTATGAPRICPMPKALLLARSEI